MTAAAMDFHNKTVFITGAASGIGRACALAYAPLGAQLYLADINAEGLAETREMILAAGEEASLAERIETTVLDVTDAKACATAIDSAVQRFGGLDVLCNIAGMVMFHHFHEISDEAWRKINALNLDSVFYLCRAALPHLLERRGNILNVASVAAKKGQAYTAAYCATKAAVLNLTRSLAVEYAKQGLRANSICPGGVDTALSASVTFPEGADFDLIGRYLPFTEISSAEEIAELMVFVSSSAGKSINGADLSIDGGVSAG